MNAFNTAAIKAQIAEVIVAKEGAAHVVMHNDALAQFFAIHDQLQKLYGREESSLTQEQKDNIAVLADNFRAADITGLAVDGVIKPFPAEQYDEVMYQILTRKEEKGVEVAYVTKLVGELIAANDKFVPAR